MDDGAAPHSLNLRSILQVFLEHRPRDEIEQLVMAKTNGATPLVLSCRNGHREVVEYLLERCNADVEQPGSVTFDGETIEGAPPLWCAAAAGHTNIVRLLTERGANVNSTTKTNSTPLRAACFDGHFDIVKYLVEKGAGMAAGATGRAEFTIVGLARVYRACCEVQPNRYFMIMA